VASWARATVNAPASTAQARSLVIRIIGTPGETWAARRALPPDSWRTARQ
jgi:hypothetical protein